MMKTDQFEALLILSNSVLANTRPAWAETKPGPAARTATVSNWRSVVPRYAPEVIALVLFALWLLGAFVAPVGGNLIHLLLFAVAAIVVVRLIQGGRILY